MGLAIVKAIVAAHGGSITVNSQPGQGSTFTFTVPVAGQSRSETDPASEVASQRIG
jgi:signal transduction histidine kinase